MAGDVRGVHRITHGGREYSFWLGWSVIADLQAIHGQDFLSRLDEPADAKPGTWMPPMSIVIDIVRLSLARYQPDVVADKEALRYLADEMLADNPGLGFEILRSAFPRAEAGNASSPRQAG